MIFLYRLLIVCELNLVFLIKSLQKWLKIKRATSSAVAYSTVFRRLFFLLWCPYGMVYNPKKMINSYKIKKTILLKYMLLAFHIDNCYCLVIIWTLLFGSFVLTMNHLFWIGTHTQIETKSDFSLHQ